MMHSSATGQAQLHRSKSDLFHKLDSTILKQYANSEQMFLGNLFVVFCIQSQRCKMGVRCFHEKQEEEEQEIWHKEGVWI